MVSLGPNELNILRPGHCINIKTIFPGMRIYKIKIRCSWDCVIFSMGIIYWQDCIFILRSPPEWNGWHFVDDILKCIFLDRNICALIQISVSFIPWGPIDSKSSLHGSDYGLPLIRWEAIILIKWTNVDQVYWYLYAGVYTKFSRLSSQLVRRIN